MIITVVPLVTLDTRHDVLADVWQRSIFEFVGNNDYHNSSRSDLANGAQRPPPRLVEEYF